MMSKKDVEAAIHIMLIYCALFEWRKYISYRIKSCEKNDSTADTAATVRKVIYNYPHYYELNRNVSIMTHNKYVQKHWLIEAIALQLVDVSYNEFMRNIFLTVAARILQHSKALPTSS